MYVMSFVLLCLRVSIACKSKTDRRDAALASPNDDNKMSSALLLLELSASCTDSELSYASGPV